MAERSQDRFDMPEPELTRWQQRGRELDPPNSRGLYPWLLLLAGPAWSTFISRDSRPLWLATLALVAFAVAWTLTIHYAFRSRVKALAPLAFVLVLAVTMVAAYRGAWSVLPAAAGIACGVTLRGREIGAVAVPFSAIAGLVAWLTGADWGDALSIAWGTFTSALIPWTILRLFAVIHELRNTREQLAHAAVEQERTRFSRDMHDLLGHSLSVMVVKAEAVRRLLPANPDAAVEQAADIETLGRQALVEVREAVTGYRGRGLSAEMDSARSALTDAGIEPTVRVTSGGLVPEADALLGWAVREGVTNVIRHSGAESCEISVTVAPVATLEIRDDGCTAGPPSLTGNGLLGLRERVEAQGGEMDAGPMPEGGFRLWIRTPNAAKATAS